MAAMYDLAPPFCESVAIVLDERRGRCLVANRDFVPGDCILEEEAMVYASYKKLGANESFVTPEMEMMIVEAYKTTTKRIMPQTPNLLKALSKLPKVASLDTARCLLQLIGIACSTEGSLNDPKAFRFRMLSQLSAANIEACTRDIRSFRKKHPKWFPKALNDGQIANLLGILNTNQMELDELGGSGLFVVAAIIEHNCVPNASFTTSGSRVYVAATRPIKSGERISLDYTNEFYSDQVGRINTLRKTYGFMCVCEACTGPDLRRRFMCDICRTGSVCPRSRAQEEGGEGGMDRGPNPEWFCLHCNVKISAEKGDALVTYENDWMDTEFVSLEHVLSRRAENVMHRNHYLIFWAISDITSQYFEYGEYDKAKKGMLETIALLDDCVEGFHHEKVLYLDKLGQLAVRLGEHELAKDSFRRAYEMSIGACGLHTPFTLKQKDMFENTPTTIEELVDRYPSKALEEDDEMDEVDDEWT